MIKLIGLGRLLPIKAPTKKLGLLSPMIFTLFIYFIYLYVTTGSFTNPITVPTTIKHALLNPQFGVNLQSPYRMIQDIVYLGFMFFPFALYIGRYLKPQTSIFDKNVSSQKILLLFSVLIILLVVISGKSFIVNSEVWFAPLAYFMFSYSGLSLALFILQNKNKSSILNYSFIALIGCVLFTFFKVGVFIIKYYFIFLPFVIIFLATRIKEKMPYILTIVIMGVFSVLMADNNIQFYENLWGKVDSLINNGVSPNDIQGQYTITNWLNGSVGNPTAKYNIVWSNHEILEGFVDIGSMKVEIVN